MKVFMDQSGRKYAGDDRLSAGDCECVNPSDRLINLLSQSSRPLNEEEIALGFAKYNELIFMANLHPPGPASAVTEPSNLHPHSTVVILSAGVSDGG